MSSGEPPAVVLDAGSDSCKVGLAGDDDPKTVIPSVVGQKGQADIKSGYVGREALEKEGLTLRYPIQRGAVTDWDGMQVLLDYIFKKALSVDPTNQPLLLTETPKTPAPNREKLAQLLFETFKVPALFFSSQAVLTLYSAGRTTGTVLDIGSGVTTVVPVFQGYSIADNIARMDFAGSDITDLLTKLLADKGHQFTKATVNTIKEQKGFVNTQSGNSSSSSASDFELPDGKKISLGDERYKCTETLFQPSLYGRPGDKGVHQMISEVIAACEMDARKSLYNNVILSGGSTLFEGMADRLRKELTSLGGPNAQARVASHKNRLVSAWTGGSVLASVSMPQTMWVSSQEYQESGPRLLRERCF